MPRAFRVMAACAMSCGAVLLASPEPARTQPSLSLSSPARLAEGVLYYTLDDPAHLEDGAPISARLIEVDPEGTILDAALGPDGTQGRATVEAIATRRGAIAAINAGFFGTTGDPAGIYKIDGLLISNTARPRGAVGIARPGGPPLLFDRVTARARLRIGAEAVAIDGIDTKRGAHSIVLYTPRYGDADRGSRGTEWVLDGEPLRATAVVSAPATPAKVPDGGFVLAAGTPPPPALAGLERGDRVALAFEYDASFGSDANAWARADDIIGGAGLLLRGGVAMADWGPERLAAEGFVEARHPRTMIGRDRDGDTWLVTVDGRQPGHSAGMTLRELTAFARRLGLVDAVNLDGGGSTTMVVKGKVVNRPSDATGARPVSDAIVVLRTPRG